MFVGVRRPGGIPRVIGIRDAVSGIVREGQTMKTIESVKRVFAAVVAVASSQVFAQATQAERPELKPGTEWVYKIDNSKRNRPGPPAELKRVIKEVGDKDYTIEITQAGNTRIGAMSLDLNPFSEGLTSSGRTSSPLPYFSFPLVPGKTYSGVLDYPSPFGNLIINLNMTTKVLDWEEVTVPGGKFRALKIEGNGRSVGGPINGTRKATLWYAPEIANYVRMEFEMSYNSPAVDKSIQELSSFSLKQ